MSRSLSTHDLTGFPAKSCCRCGKQSSSAEPVERYCVPCLEATARILTTSTRIIKKRGFEQVVVGFRSIDRAIVYCIREQTRFLDECAVSEKAICWESAGQKPVAWNLISESAWRIKPMEAGIILSVTFGGAGGIVRGSEKLEDFLRANPETRVSDTNHKAFLNRLLRKWAMATHPDQNPSNAKKIRKFIERFQDLNWMQGQSKGTVVTGHGRRWKAGFRR